MMALQAGIIVEGEMVKSHTYMHGLMIGCCCEELYIEYIGALQAKHYYEHD